MVRVVVNEISAGVSRKRKRFDSEIISWYLLIIIPIIGFFALKLYPMLWTASKAWYYYDGAKATMRYVGLDNFKTLFSDKTYWNSWLVTLKFAVYKLPLELPLAMLIALMLDKKLKGSSLFRAIYYMPHILSFAIIGVIFSGMFDYFGFINGLLKKMGFSQVNWFAESGPALAVLVIASTWNSFGVNAMYFLAALQNIPKDLYESAYLDGASKATVFFKITLPLMGPVLSTILLLSINGTLQVNDLVLVTTNGAPAGKTYSVMAYMISRFIPGFATGSVNIGYGCATAIISSVLYILIAVVYTRLSKKLSDIY